MAEPMRVIPFNPNTKPHRGGCTGCGARDAHEVQLGTGNGNVMICVLVCTPCGLFLTELLAAIGVEPKHIKER